MYLFGNSETTDHMWYSGQFVVDFMVWLPLGLLGYINHDSEFLKILWMIKIYRIKVPLQILNKDYYGPILKNLQEKKIQQVLNDHTKCDDTCVDHLDIHRNQYISALITLIRLVIEFQLTAVYVGVVFLYASQYIHSHVFIQGNVLEY